MVRTYKVLARGDIAVLDAAYAEACGKYRLVGRELSRVYKDEEVPDDVVRRDRDPVDPDDKFHIECWARKTEPSVVTAEGHLGQYFRSRIIEGGLWPADKATADACGVPFDPKFGSSSIRSDKKVGD
jgi:hypothetical protein